MTSLAEDLFTFSVKDENEQIIDQMNDLDLNNQIKTKISWNLTLFADYGTDQFLLIVSNVNFYTDISLYYDWNYMTDFRLDMYFNKDEMLYAELVYINVGEEITFFPKEFSNIIDVYMILNDDSLHNEGYIKNLFSEPAELNFYKDPLYGKNISVPISIKY